jgi:hypothetical protein
MGRSKAKRAPTCGFILDQRRLLRLCGEDFFLKFYMLGLYEPPDEPPDFASYGLTPDETQLPPEKN